MNIHLNLDLITQVALKKAKEHNCNYNIIISNPNKEGEFDILNGSTYEFVADSYFEKERPNIKRIITTDDLNKLSEEKYQKINMNTIVIAGREKGIGVALNLAHLNAQRDKPCPIIPFENNNDLEIASYLTKLSSNPILIKNTRIPFPKFNRPKISPILKPIKIGRNSLCQCGSKKKDKNCCKNSCI